MCESGPGKKSVSRPVSDQRTKYGGSPLTPCTSTISPSLTAAPTVAPATTIRSPTCACMIVSLLTRRSAARDLDPLLGRLAARLRHPDLQHAIAVRGRDNLRSGALGQSDLAYEASVSEFGAVALVRFVLPLLPALRLDGQHTVIDGDVNVPLRVDAGQFGSDDDVILVGELLHLDGGTSHRLLASREPAEVLERPARQQFAEMARPAGGGEWLLGSERRLRFGLFGHGNSLLLR